MYPIGGINDGLTERPCPGFWPHDRSGSERVATNVAKGRTPTLLETRGLQRSGDRSRAEKQIAFRNPAEVIDLTDSLRGWFRGCRDDERVDACTLQRHNLGIDRGLGDFIRSFLDKRSGVLSAKHVAHARQEGLAN